MRSFLLLAAMVREQLNMRPCVAASGPPDHRHIDVKFARQTHQCPSLFAKLANLAHVFICEFRVTVKLAISRRPPALRNTVSVIVQLGSRKQMQRTKAWWIVALMKNTVAIRYRPNSNNVREPMRSLSLGTVNNYSISSVTATPRPHEARILAPMLYRIIVHICQNALEIIGVAIRNLTSFGTVYLPLATISVAALLARAAIEFTLVHRRALLGSWCSTPAAFMRCWSITILALFGQCLYSLDNSVVLRNNYTGALTDHPISFGRFFARGELANYPRPFATPNDTGTRAAITTWQADILSRWPDQSAARTITGGRVGALTWSTGAGISAGGITIASTGVATIPFDSAHNITVGTRLVLSKPGGGSLTTASGSAYVYGSIDNAVVSRVVDSTHVEYLSRHTASVGGAFVTGTSYTDVQVEARIDPYEPVDVCRITSDNHGFYRSDSVTLANISGLTKWDGSPLSGTFIVTGISRNAFVINERCAGAWTSGGTATGTSIGAGSVRFARVSFITTVPASGTTRIDFVNSTDPSSAGNAAATATAGFDETEMLAATWNFNLVATASVKSGSTPAITTVARDILTAGDVATASYCKPRIWARGPVETVVIVEYGCAEDLDYDFGWKIRVGTTFSSAAVAGDTQLHVADATNIDAFDSTGTNKTVLFLVAATDTNGDTVAGDVETMTVEGTPVVAPTTCTLNGVPTPITTGACVTVTRAISGIATSYASGRPIGIRQWEDAPSNPYKSLHPVFTLRFINGWSGVGGRVEVYNDWAGKLQNIFYQIDLQTGGTPASRITKGTAATPIKHHASASWQLSTWDGSDPDFFCKGGAGTDPDNCATTGGGTRARRYLIDYNTAYLIYARMISEWRLWASKATSLDAAATTFKTGNKGGFTAGGLGAGTWGAAESNSAAASAVASGVPGQDGSQEAFVLNDVQAACLQNWSEACFEINFSDSTGGGAGNVEAGFHDGLHYREDNDLGTAVDGVGAQMRFVMAGFGDPVHDRAHNRAISVYGRPTYVATPSASAGTQLAAADFDKRGTACTASAPAFPASVNSAASIGGNQGWPCYILLNYVGLAGWDTSSNQFSHQNDWYELAYALTADFRYLRAIQSVASWNDAREYGGSGRGVGKSWGSTESGNNVDYIPRMYGGWLRNQLAAALWTPNVPQFGFTVPSVETFYRNSQLLDSALGKEGNYGITDGLFVQMYPHLNSFTCPGTTPGNIANIWLYGRCAGGGNQANPLAFMTRAPSPCTYPYINCAGGYTERGHWYFHHASLQWSKAAGLGFTMFNYVRRNFTNFSFSIFGSANWNPYMNGFYQSPFKVSGRFVTTLTEYFDGWTHPGTWGSGQNRNQEIWCIGEFDCSSSNTSYNMKWRGDIAQMKDLARTMTGTLDGCSATSKTPAGCTWLTAFNMLNKTLPKQDTWGTMTKYVIEPRADILDLTCTPGATTAICTFTAPTNDATSYAVVATGTGFASTLDATCTSGCPASDTVIPAAGLKPTFVITGLTAATGYTVRVTAGQRLAAFSPTAATGTGRATTVFTTLASEGGATTVTVNHKATAPATTATIDYGTTSAVSGGSLGPTGCDTSAGCSFNVPGNARALVWHRVTYKTAGGTTVAQGQPQPAIIP